MLTEKQLTDIYERELENAPSAGSDVLNAKRSFHAALDEYCAALNYEAGRMESEVSTAEDCFSINKKER